VNETQMTVLCIDDDDLELKARRGIFEAAGFRVLEARSKDAALSIFQSSLVDAVVLDYWLSGVSGDNGTAIAEEIKRRSAKTPILMLSGYGFLPGEAAIVDSWLIKSTVSPQDLIREVERLIEHRRQNKA
jgi:DNA-binding NtrC family response regulator